MDPYVRVWWLSLCAAGAINAGAWAYSVGLYRRKVAADRHFADRWLPLVLSGVYAAICSFRGILPRADVQRICLFDTFLSSVAVGRTVATVAELCCVLQWSLLAHEMGRAAGSRALLWIGKACVALIVIAECCSWYAVLTTHYGGNTVEESCWTLMAGLLALGMLALLLKPAARPLRGRLVAGMLGCAAYVTFMVLVDVRMYLVRWRADAATGKTYLTLAQGLQDVAHHWVVTGAWLDWKPEMAWMTLYFTVSVWALIALAHVPRFPGVNAGTALAGRS